MRKENRRFHSRQCRIPSGSTVTITESSVKAAERSHAVANVSSRQYRARRRRDTLSIWWLEAAQAGFSPVKLWSTVSASKLHTLLHPACSTVFSSFFNVLNYSVNYSIIFQQTPFPDLAIRPLVEK